MIIEFKMAVILSLFLTLGFAKSAFSCTKIISKTAVKEFKTLPRFKSFDAALKKYNVGDILCLSDSYSTKISISDFNSGNKPLTIRPINNLGTTIVSTKYTGTGIRIENSSGIIIQGMIITGGLFAIKVEDSSNIQLISNVIYNVGNEGILIKPNIHGGRNFLIKNNTIFDTGNLHPRYGEGVYIGDGAYNKDKSGLKIKNTVSNILITGNVIYNTSNEAIDIKSNAYNVKVVGNYINNIDLKFNAAITVATEASFSSAGGYHIENNVISDINNRSGYHPIGIAIGHGDATVINNTVIDKDKRLIAICLFTTFLNPQLNKVILTNNKLIGRGTLLSKECTGGTSVNAQAVVEIR